MIITIAVITIVIITNVIMTIVIVTIITIVPTINPGIVFMDIKATLLKSFMQQSLFVNVVTDGKTIKMFSVLTTINLKHSLFLRRNQTFGWTTVDVQHRRKITSTSSEIFLSTVEMLPKQEVVVYD